MIRAAPRATHVPHPQPLPLHTMRVAILSPYSWTYPGGVTRHIEALAERFIDDGHHVRVLAPYDPPGRYSSALHRGARPQEMPKPEYLVSLGRTLSLKANQAVSNVSITPHAYATALQELRTGNYDVVHVHEPLAPVSPWLITDQIDLPLVGTFHTYNENRISNGIATALGARRMLNRLHVRIAVSEAAAWTARRFFGGHYRIIPNGVLRRRRTRRARRAASPVRQAEDRVRRPGGRAQGAPGAAEGVRGAARAHPDRADRDRPVRAGALPDDARHARRARARQGRRRDQADRARGRRRAVRPIARRRELRDGADRGVRGGHAGGRVGHRRLPGRGARRRRRDARAAGRRPGAGRGAARPLRGARPPRRDGTRRRARRRAIRVAAGRGPGDGGLRGRDRRPGAVHEAPARRGQHRRARRPISSRASRRSAWPASSPRSPDRSATTRRSASRAASVLRPCRSAAPSSPSSRCRRLA